MVKLKKRHTIEKPMYSTNDNSTLVEVIEQYHYDTEEEKTQHCNEMETKGFADSGQVKENIGFTDKPTYVWYGSYYKWELKPLICKN